MNYEIKEIQENIRSNSKELLDQSMKIVDEHLAKEVERGKSAVTRVNTLITLSGAASAVALFFGKIILNIYNSNLLILIYLIYSITILFLIKSVYYSIRSLRPTQVYRLSPDLIFDIQEKDVKEALRYEVSWKIWEYFQMITVNTQRLFWFNRGQRNMLFSIIFFLFLGLLLLINRKVPVPIPNLIEYILGGIFILFAVFCDLILDRVGFWYFE